MKEVLVKLWIEEAGVRLVVEDQGKGFDLGALPSITCGLSGTDERVTTLRGELQISSKPGEGTRVEARLPLQWAD